jgi:hypothetical protein
VFQLVVACWLEPVVAVVENGSVVELLAVPLAVVAFVSWEQLVGVLADEVCVVVELEAAEVSVVERLGKVAFV